MQCFPKCGMGTSRGARDALLEHGHSSVEVPTHAERENQLLKFQKFLSWLMTLW